MGDIKLPFVLGLAGRKRAGKTTLAEALEERGWVKLSFADPVRELALKLDPIVTCRSEGPDPWNYEAFSLSDIVEGVGWDTAKEDHPEVRRILQVVGTELGRAFDPDIWVNKLAARVYKYPPDAKIVIDDVRFPNEANKIRHAWGGKVVLLEGGEGGDDHESESHFDRLDVSARMEGFPDGLVPMDFALTLGELGIPA